LRYLNETYEAVIGDSTTIEVNGESFSMTMTCNMPFSLSEESLTTDSITSLEQQLSLSPNNSKLLSLLADAILSGHDNTGLLDVYLMARVEVLLRAAVANDEKRVEYRFKLAKLFYET
jgi:hypothetical protein